MDDKTTKVGAGEQEKPPRTKEQMDAAIQSLKTWADLWKKLKEKEAK
jgi:hypothetical protein